MKTTVVTLLILIGTVTRAHAGVDITACGQDVPRGTATLQVDLTSCPSDSNAITLRDGAKLDLNGFAVASGDTGVFCIQGCVIRGPGEITGTRIGVRTLGQANLRLVMKDVDIHDNTGNGIMHDGGIEQGKTPRVRLTRVTSRNNGAVGIGVFHGRLSGSDVNVSDNAAEGIGSLEQFKLKRLTVQRNGRDGLAAPFGGGRLLDSLLAFNGETAGGVDIHTHDPPILVRTECGYSATYGTTESWGICAGDE